MTGKVDAAYCGLNGSAEIKKEQKSALILKKYHPQLDAGTACI